MWDECFVNLMLRQAQHDRCSRCHPEPAEGRLRGKATGLPSMIKQIEISFEKVICPCVLEHCAHKIQKNRKSATVVDNPGGGRFLQFNPAEQR